MITANRRVIKRESADSFVFTNTPSCRNTIVHPDLISGVNIKIGDSGEQKEPTPPGEIKPPQ